MEKLGCSNPCDTVVFEDAFYAANTARNTGFYVVGISDVTETKADKMKEICHQYIDNFNDIDFNLLPH